jgi:hypothetical protein
MYFFRRSMTLTALSRCNRLRGIARIYDTVIVMTIRRKISELLVLPPAADMTSYPVR